MIKTLDLLITSQRKESFDMLYVLQWVYQSKVKNAYIFIYLHIYKIYIY